LATDTSAVLVITSGVGGNDVLFVASGSGRLPLAVAVLFAVPGVSPRTVISTIRDVPGATSSIVQVTVPPL
jgi:hypothetical protein